MHNKEKRCKNRKLARPLMPIEQKKQAVKAPVRNPNQRLVPSPLRDTNERNLESGVPKAGKVKRSPRRLAMRPFQGGLQVKKGWKRTNLREQHQLKKTSRREKKSGGRSTEVQGKLRETGKLAHIIWIPSSFSTKKEETPLGGETRKY